MTSSRPTTPHLLTNEIPSVLRRALESGRAPVSVGLEPAADYLPPGVEPTIAGYERFLRTIIDATAKRAAAFKINIAFFESLGSAGFAMLERVRATIPDGAFVILDAKRGDIGSTAKHYAAAAFDCFGAHAITINPLMGCDAAAPFLERPDTMAYLLCLTSNKGAADFLTKRFADDDGGGVGVGGEGGRGESDRGDRSLDKAPTLARLIAERGRAWAAESAASVGFVVGATNAAEHLDELAQPLAGAPLLVPGIGAQGGDATRIVERFGDPVRTGTLFHVTRGVLPTAADGADDHDRHAKIIARKLDGFITSISAPAASEPETRETLHDSSS